VVPEAGRRRLLLNVDRLVASGLVPDVLLRAAIRRLCARRLREEGAADAERAQERHAAFVAAMRESPIALETRAANDQHYEVPPAFFRIALGRRLKYSSALFPPGVADLDAAEEAMLDLTCRRARLADGQDVLELGCGWGSLTLFMAARYPRARILAVSNSRDQRLHVEEEARRQGLANVTVLTEDMNVFEAGRTFDRVVSVEMFEHMRNWPRLFARVASWMRPDARFFLHVFAHRDVAYPFDAAGESDWMARNFFTGGLMPSDRLVYEFGDDLAVEEHWRVGGLHYAKTSEAWLANLDARRDEARHVFAEAGDPDPRGRVETWRVFFMACAELFATAGGNEWLVSHSLLRRRAPR
jgi:cyclopropane-fatty-acyl-phospholipid synthase